MYIYGPLDFQLNYALITKVKSETKSWSSQGQYRSKVRL